MPADTPAAETPAAEMPADLAALARAAKGFMPDDEGLALYRAARSAGGAARSAGGAARAGHCALLEVGAYCGKSTIWLGAAAREEGIVCWSVDHHRGSEELQAGWEHHDPSLVDPRSGRMDSLPVWRRTVEAAGLEPWVIAVVGDSPTVAAHWGAPLALVFIDGGHGSGPAWADYRGWAPHVALGGALAIHDVFVEEAQGGRPPYEIWRAALDSGAFEEAGACGSLRILRRVRPCE